MDAPTQAELLRLRTDYRRAALDEASVAADPHDQLARWLREAIDASLTEPNAMTLATSTRDGDPSARVVLLKSLDDGRLSFFTNYDSAKGRQLVSNPRAAAVFYWPELERQARITGRVARLDRASSRTYFQSRPEGARLSAWVSPQSQVVPDRAWLEAALERLAGAPGIRLVEPPPHWGGYALTPNSYEFWQGRPDRLHDRIRYRIEGEDWRIERLAP
ncbi:MAG: pyridoxamine 5'-phosphate oxidase [Dehalococcoidia bacterium]